MRSAAFLLLLAAIGTGMTGCGAFEMSATPVMRNGWMVYTGDATTVDGFCGALPVQLNGSHTTTQLDGDCRQITVTGNHNDVIMGLEPGARIDVVGTHNDIWWHMLRAGPPPLLIDHGGDNRFHLKTT